MIPRITNALVTDIVGAYTARTLALEIFEPLAIAMMPTSNLPDQQAPRPQLSIEASVEFLV